MPFIRLQRDMWEIDLHQQLGTKGGFGTVFAGTKEGFPPLAIKKLDISASESANRELRIADQFSGNSFKHVIPTYDSGQDAESDFYYVVMARAEKNLQEELEHRGHFEEAETAGILLQIMGGLEEIHPIVHRDLKPGNILLHEGLWKISDFGIAKFVEESTSLLTLKGCLSPPYAAPEQWQLEPVSVSTDLYAVGCIAYQLLSGNPPFRASSNSEFQKQHLYSEPAALDSVSPLVQTLVSMLLRKSPESRPTIARSKGILENIISRLESPRESIGSRDTALSSTAVAEQISSLTAKMEAVLALNEKRAKLGSDAFEILKKIQANLFQSITDKALAAKREEQNRRISLGEAWLQFQWMNGGDVFPENSSPESNSDIICGAIIKVVQQSPKYYWSASLWYTNHGAGNTFRWIEVSYWHAGGKEVVPYVPFALEDPNVADLAHLGIMPSIYIATHPRYIDDEHVEDFIERWSFKLAQAYRGELRYPGTLPID
jgi:serine/threonine protein kinase